MSIMMVTSLNTYTKNMEMKMKWQKKQTEKAYTTKDTGSTNSKDATVRQQLEEIRESASDNSAQMAAQIELKMKTGKRLSAKEMEYLKEHDPETYKKAKAIEMEREAYERELKNCKTKEEVQRVKAAHAAAGLDQVNNIKNNPNIPSGKKLELINQELAKSNALEDSLHSFVKSGEYKKLPSEAEKQKAEKEMEEARKAELGLDEDSKDKAAETDKEEETSETADMEPQASDSTAPADMDTQARVSDNAAPADKDHVSAEKATSSAAADVSADSRTRKAREIVTEQKKTRVQAEVTPEARKVRHAKAKAAYTANQMQITETQAPKINIKK